jgi:hypothetical protein
MSAFKEKIFPLMKGIDNLFMKGDGVPIMGSMVFR